LQVREIQFYSPGVPSYLSATPCEDIGLEPVSRVDCEIAAPQVVPRGQVMGTRVQNQVSGWLHGCVCGGIVGGCVSGMHAGWLDDAVETKRIPRVRMHLKITRGSTNGNDNTQSN
jgi:hypothetical protein